MRISDWSSDVCSSDLTLRRQYRMLPPIGEIVSKSFYDGRLEHGRVTPVIDPDALPPLLAKPVTWIDTAPPGERGKQSDPNQRNSLSNAAEHDAVVARLQECGESAEFIGGRSEENSVGKKCVRQCQYERSPAH